MDCANDLSYLLYVMLLRFVYGVVGFMLEKAMNEMFFWKPFEEGPAVQLRFLTFVNFSKPFEGPTEG